jgi:hypothetical protein
MDDSRSINVHRMTLLIEATAWSFTYNPHSDDVNIIK